MIITWGIVASLASLQISILDTGWTYEMYAISILFPFSVYIGVVIGKNNNIKREKKYANIEFSNIYFFLSRLIFLLCLVCAFMEWKSQGFILPFFSKGLASDTKHLVSTLPFFHYGTVYLPYCSINAFFELCFSKRKKLWDKILLFIQFLIPIFHCLLIATSRGSLLIIILGILFILSRKYKIKFNKLYIIVIIILIILVKVAEQRITSVSLVFRVIPEHPLLSSLYSYTAVNFENLNKLTKVGPSWSIFIRSFYGLLQTIGLGGLFPEKPKQITVFLNACPIAYDFYDDLWLIGVVLYTILLTVILKVVYRKCNKSSRWIILIAALQKPIWVVFFGNYFWGYRIIFFPLIISWLLVKSNDYVWTKRGLRIIKKNEDRFHKLIQIF